MMATKRNTKSRPANEQFGYDFGVDGLMTIPQVMDFLACSKSTVYRLMYAGRIRRGKIGPVVRICRRSLTEYANGIES